MKANKRGVRDSLALLCFGAAWTIWALPVQSGGPQHGLAGAATAMTLPAGTKVELALTVPLWAAKVKPGDPFYSQTNFPVMAGNAVAIPAGTWVQGDIESLALPTRKSNRAELILHFSKIIFANGYTVLLPDSPSAVPAPNPTVNAAPVPTTVQVAIQASTANDLLLDYGAQVEMTLAMPLELDTSQVAKAIPLSRPMPPGKFKSATLCRDTPDIPGDPGTPGTSDTVIPGTPGTPDITIPQGPDMPDITIPGTPGTPDTVIPGSPGTPGTPDIPGTVCPAAPIVISSTPVAANTAQNKEPGPATAH